MLVDFFRHGNDRRIYQFDSDRSYCTLSSNNNLMFTKESYFGDVRYPIDNKYQEDVYLCLANLKRRNRYMINSEIKIRHLPRFRFKDLISQFFHYGRYFAEGTAAIDFGGLEFFSNLVATPRHTRRGLLFRFRFPVAILCFVSLFHFLILSSLLLILKPTWGTFLGFLASAYLYFLSDFRMLTAGLIPAIRIGFTRLCINVALFCGHIRGSLSQRKIILGPLIEAGGNHAFYLKEGANLSEAVSLEFSREIRELATSSRDEVEDFEIESIGGPYHLLSRKGLFYLLRARSFFAGYELLSVARDRFQLLLETAHVPVVTSTMRSAIPSSAVL